MLLQLYLTFLQTIILQIVPICFFYLANCTRVLYLAHYDLANCIHVLFFQTIILQHVSVHFSCKLYPCSFLVALGLVSCGANVT